MKGMVDLSSLYDAPIDPATVDFATKQGRACRSCLFQRQKISVCNEVVRLALLAGLVSCDVANVVYVKRKRDPRQVDLTKGEDA